MFKELIGGELLANLKILGVLSIAGRTAAVLFLRPWEGRDWGILSTNSYKSGTAIASIYQKADERTVTISISTGGEYLTIVQIILQ